jgi:hypothetical protein
MNDMSFEQIFDPDHFQGLLVKAHHNRKKVERSEPNLESMRTLFAAVDVVIAVIPTGAEAREFTVLPLKGCDLVQRYRNGQPTVGPVRWTPVLVYSPLEAEALSEMFGDVSDPVTV